MITLFHKGDPVPAWVLRAPVPWIQDQSEFMADAVAVHSYDKKGLVLLMTRYPLPKGRPGFLKLASTGYPWQGNPTEIVTKRSYIEMYGEDVKESQDNQNER